MNMKKLILSAIAFFALGISLSFAQKSPAASMNEIANLLDSDNFFKRGVFRNSEEITEIAKTLPLENRQLLYNRYAEDASFPTLINAIAGFGIGSFMQKNYLHASIQATGDTIFTIWMIAAIDSFLISKDKLDGERASHYGYYESSGYGVRNMTLEESSLQKAEDDYRDARSSLITAAVFWTFFRVYECVTPILFTRSYNKKLAESLGIYDFNANISPSISANGSLNMKFSVALKL